MVNERINLAVPGIVLQVFFTFVRVGLIRRPCRASLPFLFTDGVPAYLLTCSLACSPHPLAHSQISCLAQYFRLTCLRGSRWISQSFCGRRSSCSMGKPPDGRPVLSAGMRRAPTLYCSAHPSWPVLRSTFKFGRCSAQTFVPSRGSCILSFFPLPCFGASGWHELSSSGRRNRHKSRLPEFCRIYFSAMTCQTELQAVQVPCLPGFSSGHGSPTLTSCS